MNNNELYHHGILGMKWGVRKTSLSSSTQKTTAQKAGSKTSAKNGETIKKSAKDMTNEELKKEIERLDLEKRYNTLNPQQISSGKMFVDTFMEKTVVPAVTEAGKQLAKDFLIKQGNRLLGLNEPKASDSSFDNLQKKVKTLVLEKQLKELTEDT